MNTQAVCPPSMDLGMEIKHFRRFLPAPLSDAVQKLWAGEHGAIEDITEFMLHREQFDPIQEPLSRRLVFQLLKLNDNDVSSKVNHLLNIVHLASGSQTEETDKWLTDVTGVKLV